MTGRAGFTPHRSPRSDRRICSRHRSLCARCALDVSPPFTVAAVCIWLAVRIVNRREARAKRLAVALLVTLFIVYPLSSGPAVWIEARMPAPWMFDAVDSLYRPLNWVYRHAPQPILDAMDWWVKVWKAHRPAVGNLGAATDSMRTGPFGGFSISASLHVGLAIGKVLPDRH